MYFSKPLRVEVPRSGDHVHHPSKGKNMSLAASFRCVLKIVLIKLGFWTFSGGWLGLERIVLTPFGLKCTPLELAPHNHVGPTDASKGHNCHWEPANIVEN